MTETNRPFIAIVTNDNWRKMVNKYLKLAFIVCGVLSRLWLPCYSNKAHTDLTWGCNKDALLCLFMYHSDCSKSWLLHSTLVMIASLLVKTISHLNINGLKNISRSKYKQDTIVTHAVWGNGILLEGKIMSQYIALHKQIDFLYLKYLLM